MSDELSYYSGKNNVKLNIDFDNSRVDILGSDVVITSPSGQRTTLPGLGITLFGENPPSITANGRSLTPDDFLGKIGQVNNLKPHEIDDVITTFDKNDGKEKNTAQKEKKDEAEVVVKEVVKVEQVFVDMNSETASVSKPSASADNSIVRMNIAEAAEKAKKEQAKRSDYDAPLDDLAPPEIVFSSPPKPSLLAFGDGFSSLSSDVKLLQTPYRLGFDDDTNMLTIYGGNGPLDAALSDEREVQVGTELIDLSEYVGETTVFTHNTSYFADNLITRVISFEALMPEQYFLTELKISGIPSGFSIAGYTPNSDGDYEFSGGELLFGNVRLLLQYDPNQFSNPPTDLDGDGILNEYANFDLTFSYGAGLLDESIATSIDTGLEDEVIIPVIVKQASADDFLYHSNPDGWVIDIDLNDNVVLTGNSDSVVYGSNAVDNITAGLGNDEVYGGGGDDIIRTGVGADTISGGTGNNVIDGGANVDTLTYSERTEDITMNLSEGANDDGFYSANIGSDFSDLLRAIEDVIAGSGDDNIRGSLVDNIITGGAGDDILDGALGNDTLSGGDGNDILKSGFGDNILDGNDGLDTVQYLQSEANIVTDLTSIDSDGYFNVTNGSFTDKVKNISVLEGSYFDDVIKGDANNHSYYGHDGDDIIDGGAGLDIIDGGDGTDIATFASLTSAISVAGNVVTDAESNAETLISIERIFGTSLNDSFIGTSGDEDYSGEFGDDHFTGTLGNDLIDGGVGTDHIDYSSLAIDLSFDFVNSAVTSLTGVSLRTDFINIETLTGSSTNSDLIDYSAETGNVEIDLSAETTSVNSSFDYNVSSIENAQTGSGDDIFTGDEANNHFQGNGGDDSFYASSGSDIIDGGTGSDTLYVSTVASGTINLDTGTISGFSSEAIENDTIISIENITQTGTGNVSIVGNSADNIIRTADGSDVVIMGAGDDDVALGDGNDTISYDEGNNKIDGGTGTDHFDVSSFSSSISLDLNSVDGDGYASLTTSDGVTQLRYIEDITGTLQDDTITGNDAINTLKGNDGDDILDGGRGLDTIDGGDGTDTATYISLANAVTVSGSSVTDADLYVENLSNIEIIAGTNFDDNFTGTASDEHYIGNDGDDDFTASLGTDIAEGGTGTDSLDFSGFTTNTSLTINLAATGHRVATGTNINASFNQIENIIGSLQSDTVTYASTSSDVTVNLNTGAATGLDGDSDYVLTGIENAIGGSGNDRIAGNNLTNYLDGGAGSDILVSSTSQSGTVNLSLVGSNQISGFSGGDSEFTGDTIINFESYEHSGSGNQNVIGSSADNIIRTGSGNDTLEGGAGADILDGNYVNAQGQEDYVFQDFEDGTADGWTTTYGNVTEQKSVDTSGSAFTNFLGQSGEISDNNETVFRTYDVTGTKDHAVLEFDLYEIDSWDFERLQFFINDTFIFQETFQHNEQEHVGRGQATVDGMTIDYVFTPQTNLTNLGFGSWSDQKHKVYLVIENPEAEIKFHTQSLTNEGLGNESYGIDNVKFYSTNNLLGIDDGTDTLSYANDTVGVTIDLEAGTGSGTGSHAEGDVISNIDNVIGGSGDDIITTKHYAVNDVDAGAGDDRVIASIGTGDTLDGGTNGSAGDTLVVRNTRSTITDLSTGTVTYAEFGDDLYGDTFSNFENYESSAFTFEKVIGTSGDNVITTGQHDDYLEGGAGDDTLNAGDGSNDWVSYENDTGTVIANLGTGSASATISGSDTLLNIENIRTGSGDDNITGSSSANTIDGGDGNDVIIASDGSDNISGKSGQDNINGGSDTDYISGGQDIDTLSGGDGTDYIAGDQTYLNGLTHFYGLNEGAGTTLSNQGTAGGSIVQGYSYDQDSSVSLAGGDGLNWEHGAADGSAYLNFLRFDDNPRPQLPSITLGKEFSISSWVKFDTPYGNQHDFVFRLGLDGNNFIDAYRNYNSNQFRIRLEHDNVQRNLNVGNVVQEEWLHFAYTIDDTGYIRVYINGVQELGSQYTTEISDSTTYTNNYLGLGWHSDESHQMDGGLSQFAIHDRALTSVEAAALYTDTKNGLDDFTIDAGSDDISGDAGADYLSGGEGSDAVSGGEGNDIILQVGDQSVDSANIIDGNDGDDTIYVRAAGNDIDGGSGTDALRYDYFSGYTTENLTIDLSTGSSLQGTVTDGTYTDNFENIETIHGGQGADTFIGDAGNNTFYGHEGGDNFYGAAGNDVFYGGDSTDTVTYARSGSAVTVNLSTGSTSNDGDGGADTLNSIENITGSDYDDSLTGSIDNNSIQAGDGDDIIFASDGADTINGGDHVAADILSYINFTQQETVTLSSSSILGNDTDSDSYSNIEEIRLGAGDDLVKDTASDVFANTIYFDFGDGADTLEISESVVSNDFVDIADAFSNLEILDFSSATGLSESTITGDDVAAFTDANNSLRLDISSSLNLTVSSGSNYSLTGTVVHSAVHETHSFDFGGQLAQLDVYTV